MQRRSTSSRGGTVTLEPCTFGSRLDCYLTGRLGNRARPMALSNPPCPPPLFHDGAEKEIDPDVLAIYLWLADHQ